MLEIIPKKVQFSKNEQVSFDCYGFSDSEGIIRVFCGDSILFTEKVEILNASLNLSHSFKAGGYLLELEIREECVQTAFDVESQMIRYGFLSDFYEGTEDEEAALQWMRKLHLNFVQYYDWMYRHDHFISETDYFQDLMGRRLSLSVIKSRLKKAHEFGMKNLAYGAIYGATNEFAAEHPDWQMYNQNGEPIGFFDFLAIMNVHRSCLWHNHIIGEYEKAIQFGFDGIHMDTYGFPKSAYDFQGKKLDLPTDFGKLIDDTREELEKSGKAIKLIFNNVGNWPVSAVANRAQDAIYIEVWNPYDTYQNIEEIIKDARSCNEEKQIILAAYLKAFEKEVTDETYNALWLLTAIITTLGATHLIHGENGGILKEGYYSRYFKINSDKAKERIKIYYDYIVYLASFWRDSSLKDVSKTHFLGDNREYISENKLLSPNFESGKIWINIRQNSEYKFINLVNLTGTKNTIWNEKKEVITTGKYQFKILKDMEIAEVSYSTPDGDKIKISNLDYSLEKNEFGEYLVLTLPALEIWGTLLIKGKNESK